MLPMTSPDDTVAQDRKSRTVIVGMVATAAALGSFLRLFRLDWQSLWVDEIHTLGPALHATSLADAFWNYINLAPTPPLYYLFMIPWIEIMGYSETALRLPSALFGIATIGVFWFGLQRVVSKETAAAATILMALSWPALFYSQEVRGYSAVLFFSTTAFVTGLQILKNFAESKLRLWVLLLAMSVLAAMTHPFGFIINGFLFLYLFAVSIMQHRWVLRSFVGGTGLLVCYLIWLWTNLGGIDWVLQGTLYSPPDFLFFVDIGAFLFHHPVPALITAVIPLSIGAGAYFSRLRGALGRSAVEDPVLFLPIMLAAPFAFVFVVAQFTPFLYTRYLIVFLPYIYAFFAVVLFARPWTQKILPVGLVFSVAVAAQFWILRDYYEVGKPQTRELAQFVLSSVDDRTAIVTGCDPSPPFDCVLGPGRATDADWSKYLFYLNRAQLPEFEVIPDVFTTMADLDQLVAQYRTNGVRRVMIIGSRAGQGYVLAAVAHLEPAGVFCSEKEFFMAVAATCALR